MERARWVANLTICWWLLLLLMASPAWAKPTTAEQARSVVATGTNLDSSASTNKWDKNFVGLEGNPTSPPFTIKKIDYIDIGGKKYWLMGSYPDINDLGQVTFGGAVSVEPDNIFLYFPNNEIVNISNNVTSTTNSTYTPIINNLGQVIWRDGYTGSHSYYLYSNGLKSLMFGEEYSASNNSFSTGGFAWMDGNDNQIYLYNNNGVTRINGDSTLNYPPCINSKGEVVWIGYAPGGLFQEIYLYKNNQRQIIDQGASFLVIGGLKINNKSQIFWFDSMTNNIRCYENGTVTNVCTFPGHISNLQINDLGEVAYVVGETSLYYFKNSNTIKVYDTTSVISDMQINNLGQIIWTVEDNIFYFDTCNRKEVIQFDDMYNALEIKLNNCGQIVWWHAGYGAEYGIYLATPQRKGAISTINKLLLLD